MRYLCAIALVAACGGDNLPGGDALVQPDILVGDLFGEPCTQPPFPEIGICRDGEGACHDEAGGSVCRPFCDLGGEPQCVARNGLEQFTDRGACVCIPKP